MNIPTFEEVRVVGMHFRERDGVPAKSIVANFVPPLTLDLEREPDNRFDEFAIKVMYAGQHIGYIEASSACYIAPWIDEGQKFRCTVEDMIEVKRNLHPVCCIEPVDET